MASCSQISKEFIICHWMTKIAWIMQFEKNCLKADDDTYVVVENLRHMLEPYDSAKPYWFGCKYSPYVQSGYMSGGAGYVLSKEALKRFVEIGISEDTGN